MGWRKGALTFFSDSVRSFPGLLTHFSQHNSVILPTTAWICRHHKENKSTSCSLHAAAQDTTP
eukprot:2444086-Rhodomonas_salina.2